MSTTDQGTEVDNETDGTEEQELHEGIEGDGDEQEHDDSDDDGTGSDDELEGDDNETDSEGEEEELEEIEYEGKKYNLPKNLKEGFMLKADYTRKTQELARSRETLDADQATFMQRVEAAKSNLKAHAELYSLDQQIEQFEKLDWNRLIEDDPVQAQKLDRELRQLTEVRNQRAQEITKEEQKQALEAQQSHAKLLEEGRAVLAREIKGWGPEMARNLADFGKGLGFSPQELNNLLDPRQVKVLHAAYQFDQLMKKATKKPAPTPAKPVKTLKGPNKAPKALSDDLPPDEWAKQRNAQIAARNRRR